MCKQYTNNCTANVSFQRLRFWFVDYWSSRSEKTLLMSTPKRPGDQIFRFTRVKLTINPLPPFETGTGLSQLFGVQCRQWEPIQNGQLIRIYKEISPSPPFKTARALSQLFAVQCRQWEPIRNGQLIGIYKEIPVQIYKHTDTKDRYKEKVSFTWVKLTIYPPGKCARPESELSIFRFTWVKLIINPPVSLWTKSCTWLYSFTFYAALYICCHFMYCIIWSWASGQVSRAFLSIANFCQFLYDFIMLLLLCITQQHLYVVVVVYYTTTTMTTTRFIEIDYEVFVK